MHKDNFIKYSLIFFLLFSSNILIAAELTNLTPGQVNNNLSKDALVIDIRTPQEWQTTGIIPGSHPVKFLIRTANTIPSSGLQKCKITIIARSEIILVCHSGGRSGKVGELLSENLICRMYRIYKMASRHGYKNSVQPKSLHGHPNLLSLCHSKQ